MHITKVELENIKSHVNSTFEFERGTTAITGENGAGKTTLIEAIAWALFDLLDYKKDDFVRRGSKKGIVRVTFESGLDERRYTVIRDTGTGYHVIDAQLETRIADKKEEVTRFLWQHLGVEAGTDLEALFRRAIGVPQGTFTAIFLESTAERKRAFDKLLKVEEYRRSADELLKTTRYLDGETQRVKLSIANAEGRLSEFDAIREEHTIVANETKELDAELTKCRGEVKEKEAAVGKIEEQEAVVGAARSAVDSAASEASRAELVVRHKEAELERSAAAKAVIAEVRSDAESHRSALERLKELDRERAERDELRTLTTRVETSLAMLLSDQRHAAEALKNAQKAHSEIAELRTKVAEQEQAEARIVELRDRIAAAKALAGRMQSLEERMARLREDYRTGKAELDAAAAKSKSVRTVAELEKLNAGLVREIAAIQASLERDELFRREIKNGLCPILSEKCLNLREGQTLEDFVSGKFDGFHKEIGALENESRIVAAELAESREAEKFAERAGTIEKRLAQIGEEGQSLKAEKERLESESGNIDELENQLQTAAALLTELDDPKAKIKSREAEAARESELHRTLSDIEKNRERLENERKILAEKAEAFSSLDARINDAAAVRDRTEQAYREMIAKESIAAAFDSLNAEVQTASAEFTAAREKVSAAERELERVSAEFDAEFHRAERARLLELQKREAELKVRLDNSSKREAELAGKIERLAELRREMRAVYRERERLEKASETTAFIRDTLKEAAPRVARNYVYHVSVEANQLYREITGNSERTLKWAEDYGIILEEGGYERPFISLSGGEQMAAAMSVRLALLKQLSDIRIAFFDEPTANMDAERRENLAQQIARIGHFDQLFVISHDDTFEGYLDHEITVGD